MRASIAAIAACFLVTTSSVALAWLQKKAQEK